MYIYTHTCIYTHTYIFFFPIYLAIFGNRQAARARVLESPWQLILSLHSDCSLFFKSSNRSWSLCAHPRCVFSFLFFSLAICRVQNQCNRKSDCGRFPLPLCRRCQADLCRYDKRLKRGHQHRSTSLSLERRGQRRRRREGNRKKQKGSRVNVVRLSRRERKITLLWWMYELLRNLQQQANWQPALQTVTPGQLGKIL